MFLYFSFIKKFELGSVIIEFAMFQVYYYAMLMIFKLGNGGMSENNYEDNYLLEGYRDYLLISSSDVEMSKWCLYIMIFIRQEKLHT